MDNEQYLYCKRQVKKKLAEVRASLHEKGIEGNEHTVQDFHHLSLVDNMTNRTNYEKYGCLPTVEKYLTLLRLM